MTLAVDDSSDRASRSYREWTAGLLLALLLVVILAAAAIAPWSSVATVDERTYLEMTRAVADGGLPATVNGSVDRFPELQARWNLHRDGRVWGTLSPGLPYLGAPLFRLGGIGLLIRVNIALLGLVALAVFALGREVYGDPLAATAAAWVTIGSIPVWASSFALSPYSLAIAGSTWAIYFGVRALSEEDGRGLGYAVLAGSLAGLASSAHLLAFPLLLGLLAGIGWSSGRRAAAALVGAMPFFVAMAALNRLRFGSWNPISDGPCAWRGCPEEGADPQSIGQMLTSAAPVILWLAATGLLLWLLRRSRALQALAGLVALGAILPESGLREVVVRYGMLVWALLVDVGSLPMGEEFRLTADRFGNFTGTHVIKALLQGTPALALAGLGLRRGCRSTRLVALTAAALIASLALRANMHPDFALGHPHLNLRYLMPAAPLLAVLTVEGVRRLPWRGRHFAGVLVVAVGLVAILAPVPDDLDLGRRYLLLRGSLLVALVALCLLLVARRSAEGRWRRTGLWATAVAFGFGFGITLGVDLVAQVRFRNRVEHLVGRVAASTPERLALFGYPDQLDAPLTLLAERDVEYADLVEFEDWTRLRPVLLWWREQGRPIYGLLPPGQVAASPWSDLRFEPVDRDINLVEVVTDEATTQEE